MFTGANMLAKTRCLDWAGVVVCLLAMLPMAVRGLGCIFSSNLSDNPRNGLDQMLPLLIVCTIVHFYTTGLLTAVTALKALDTEVESVSACLKLPFYKTFWRVTLPICPPTVIDIARCFLTHAMTTVAAGGTVVMLLFIAFGEWFDKRTRTSRNTSTR